MVFPGSYDDDYPVKLSERVADMWGKVTVEQYSRFLNCT